MFTKVQRWGNSLAVRIPKAFAVDARLENDALVEINLDEGKIVITPVSTRGCGRSMNCWKASQKTIYTRKLILGWS